MRKAIILSAHLLCLLVLTACQNDNPSAHHDTGVQASITSETPVSQTLNFNKDWLFKKSQTEQSAGKISAAWQTVDLPHTPRLEPQIVNHQWQGFAWYQKTFQVPESWLDKAVLIRFEGAMNVADIWLNGEKVGGHIGGYLPFTLDLSPYLKSGDNQIQVRLDNRDNEITGPKPLHLLDFNTYGGLYRDVNLLIKDKLMITDEMLANEVAGGGIFVTFPKVSESSSVLVVKTQLQNRYAAAKSVRVEQTLLWQSTPVANNVQRTQLLENQSLHVEQRIEAKQVKLWSPKTPNLYSLQTKVFDGERLVEQQSRKIGFREFTFNQQHELLINGEKTFLRGVNRHQDYPHVGYATSAQADYRDAVKIKAAGFDYVRLSHYPHSTAFMQAADELGLVLIDAVLGWQYYNPDPAFEAHIIQSCADLIRRDRNHASVLGWECSLNESDMPDDFIARLDDTVHKEFPGAYSAGWEKGYDIYLQARQHRLQHYETPNQPYVVSEYGDWEYYAQNAGLNQDNWGDLKDEERTSRQLLNSGEKRLLQQSMNLQEAHDDNHTVPAFADGYWVMFDYNRGYADDIESSGIASLYRQPKYSYYFFASQRDADEVSDAYASGPMVHIASEWTKNSATKIRVFSNAQQVALYLNDELVEQKSASRDKYSQHLAHPPIHFDVAEFRPGTLRADAIIDGKVVASHTVATPGEATQLALRLDVSGVKPVAGSKDLVFVYADLLDSNGNKVPANDVALEVALSGDIQLLNQEAILTSQGQGALLIRIGDSLAGASITVSGIGLTSASLNLAQ
ncbi:sugar-binding domain-containing protein [Aliiglaciecola sp. LCG003]|uniref:glycoside hydrolase family 2 protein n=1 Tax=Aliiglaciecola sp. LCG003 TaxID=3053655 RepID=UPI002572BD80|nr:sugar-binding domain-containing protein [Aliiglaciecola sp. LCG003]WJG10089.1 glycoside hydrolase family 2 TIM barrel-domain containing protein [Aliiglaciecola sp. LCG003]